MKLYVRASSDETDELQAAIQWFLSMDVEHRRRFINLHPDHQYAHQFQELVQTDRGKEGSIVQSERVKSIDERGWRLNEKQPAKE